MAKRPTKSGQRVIINDKTRKFFKNQAYSLNTVAGSIIDESGAYGFMKGKLLGLGFKYKATTGRYYPDCGDGPGYKVHIDFGNGLPEMSTIIEVKNLKRLK